MSSRKHEEAAARGGLHEGRRSEPACQLLPKQKPRMRGKKCALQEHDNASTKKEKVTMIQ